MQRCLWLWPWLGLFLSVQVPGAPRTPLLLMSANPRLVRKHSNVTITCEVNHSPETSTVYWFRQTLLPREINSNEFLASYSGMGSVYGNDSFQARATVSKKQDRNAYVLELKNATISDSGIYFCCVIQSPAFIFGPGIDLKVVENFPTTKPTTVLTTRKKTCRPKPKDQVEKKGLSCMTLPLVLLVGCFSVLLISLIVTIHLHCLWRRARLRFLKNMQI
ncbi:T-cell surface glycoprotein CD8 beta chain-like [Tachyglossus aculeatus]|uniref:T-cell surface glycoprotein CD8 beta chain-like n=1 Tax=Tachyglossus aculeatus TaxID=9261 RepID=UPI0018F75150|nr:T-cell surface glycoprotein CD8 beta chain-like [Tachyglossus aculeatus]